MVSYSIQFEASKEKKIGYHKFYTEYSIEISYFDCY